MSLFITDILSAVKIGAQSTPILIIHPFPFCVKAFCKLLKVKLQKSPLNPFPAKIKKGGSKLPPYENLRLNLLIDNAFDDPGY